MEDVARRWVLMYLLACSLLCGDCIDNHSVLAANQGSIGSTSTASATITVHIPRTVQLIVDEVSQPTFSTQTNFCLSVIDTTAPEGPNHYRIDGLTQMYFDQSQLIELHNRYGLPINDMPTCQEGNANFSVNRENANAVVLMLEPE